MLSALLSLALLVQVTAPRPCVDIVTRLRLLNDPTLYVPENCPGNICNLIDGLTRFDSTFDIKRARLLFIDDQHDQGFYFTHSEDSDGGRNYYHVALLADDLVHDFDFRPERVIPFKTYFEQMFLLPNAAVPDALSHAFGSREAFNDFHQRNLRYTLTSAEGFMQFDRYELPELMFELYSRDRRRWAGMKLLPAFKGAKTN